MRLAMHARFRIFAVALCAAGLCAAGLLSPGPARAQEITYLQMANMTATAKTPDGRRASVPVTAFLQVESTQAASTICRRVPVVRSAVLDATGQQPIPYAKGHLESDSISAFVTDRINAALGTKIVAHVAFIHGTPKEAPATATDLADAGDMIARDRSAKTGQIGQMAPCRRIVAPPRSLNWVNAEAKKPTQTLAPPAPPLRENRAPAPSAPEFKTHPQFAPPPPPQK